MQTAKPLAPVPVGPVTLQQVRDAWPEILERVEKAKRSSWMVVFASQARALKDDVLTVAFQSETDAARFKEQQQGAAESVSEHLRRAILDVLGIRVKFIARVESGGPAEDLAPPPEPEYDGPGDPYDRGTTEAPPAPPPVVDRPTQPAAPRPQPEPVRSQPATGGWSVVQIPRSEPSQEDSSPVGNAGPASPPAPVPEPVEGSLPSPEGAVGPGSGIGGLASGPVPSSASKKETAPATRQGPQRPPAPERAPDERRRYGESVVREILNASFIEEQKIAPPTQRPEF